MIELASKKDQDFIIDTMLNFREGGIQRVPILEIAGEDFSPNIPDGDYSQDGIAISLEATFIGDVPLDYYDYVPTKLSVMVGNVLVPAMDGFMALIEPEDELLTDKITAATPGSLADKMDLNEEVNFPGDPPHYAVRNALYRLPYRPGSVEVDVVNEPVFYAAPGRGEDGPFAPDEKVNAILDRVAEKVPYVYRDTAQRGHKAKVSPGLAKVPDIPDYLRFRSEDLIFWKSPSTVVQRVARVIVFKKNQDGSDAFEPAVANVRPRNPDYPTPYGITERIPWSGDAESAQSHAYFRALFLGRGQFKSEPTLPYFPLLETTDAFSVTEVKVERPGEGYYEREWLHYVDTFEQAWGEGGSGQGQSDSRAFQTNPVCSTGLLNEQFVKAPTLNLSLVSRGIVQTPLSSFVNNTSGFFRQSDLTYVTNDATGMFVDPALSGGKVTHDASGFSFSLN